VLLKCLSHFIFFYRATHATHTGAVLAVVIVSVSPSVCLSVCHTCALRQNRLVIIITFAFGCAVVFIGVALAGLPLTSMLSEDEYDDVVIVPLPDAPMGVQVEAGPQRGTLLVMWTPVADKKPVDEEAAELIRVITGYTVYVDGTLVKQLDSPTGQ